MHSGIALALRIDFGMQYMDFGITVKPELESPKDLGASDRLTPNGPAWRAPRRVRSSGGNCFESCGVSVAPTSRRSPGGVSWGPE